jgi:hypothetical protein
MHYPKEGVLCMRIFKSIKGTANELKKLSDILKEDLEYFSAEA